MKKIQFIPFIFILMVVQLNSAFGQDKEIDVSGKVTDTLGNPLSEAMVILSSGISVNPISADTVYTGKSGLFSRRVTVDQNAYGIAYRVSKDGFNSKFGYGLVDSTNIINVGTIVLTKGITQKITVFGRVLDTVTGDPIEGAMVRLSIGISVIDTLYDSVHTDAEGKFSREIDATSWVGITARLIYLVTKDEYEPKYGMEMIQGTSVDLGDIYLLKTNVQIVNNSSIKKSLIVPNNIEVYSLNGQLLYSGRVIHLENLVAKSIVNSQPVIACYKSDKKLLYQRKIILHH